MYSELKKYNINPDVCAGLSLGEYAAMVVAGVMDFGDAVRAVRRRGILMQNAVPLGAGAMSAVLGLDNTTVENICNDIDGVGIANYNCPGQVVITGIPHAIKVASERLSEAGAKRILPLNVSGPFHSFMLKGAGDELESYLADITINKPVIPYVTNVTAEYVTDNAHIRELLGKQVHSSVKWQHSVEKMINNGADKFVEIGPGRTISGFIRKINSNVKVYNIQKFEDVKKVVEALKGDK